MCRGEKMQEKAPETNRPSKSLRGERLEKDFAAKGGMQERKGNLTVSTSRGPSIATLRGDTSVMEDGKDHQLPKTPS